MKRFKKRLVTIWLIAAAAVVFGAAGYIIRPWQVQGAQSKEGEYSTETVAPGEVTQNNEQESDGISTSAEGGRSRTDNSIIGDNNNDNGLSMTSLKDLVGEYCIDAVSDEITVDDVIKVSEMLTEEQQKILITKLIEYGVMHGEDDGDFQTLYEKIADAETLLTYNFALREEDREKLVDWMLDSLEDFENQIYQGNSTISEEELTSYVKDAFETAIREHVEEIVFERKLSVTDEDVLRMIIAEVGNQESLPYAGIQEILTECEDIFDDEYNSSEVSMVTEEEIEVILEQWATDIGSEFSRIIQYYNDRIDEMDAFITSLQNEQKRVDSKILELEQEKDRISLLNVYVEALEDKTRHSFEELDKETEANITKLKEGLEQLIQKLSDESSGNDVKNNSEIAELKEICAQLNADKASEISMDLLESELRELIDREKRENNDSTAQLAASILENVNRLSEIEREYIEINNIFQEKYELLQNELDVSSEKLKEEIASGDERLDRQISELNQLTDGLQEQIDINDSAYKSSLDGLQQKVDLDNGALKNSLDGLQQKVDLDNGALKNSFDGLQQKVDLDNGALKSSLDGLQQKVDLDNGTLKESLSELEKLFGSLDSLLTNEKSNIVSAINEVFQYASEGKRKLADALNQAGVNADSNASFQSLADGIGKVADSKYNEGIVSADERCNKASVSYKSGYSDGNSTGYSNGYSEGYSDGKLTCKVEEIDLYSLRSEGQTWMHTIEYNVGKGYKQVYCQVDYTWLSGSGNRFIIDYEYNPDTGIFKASAHDWGMNEIAMYCGEEYASTKITVVAVK
ncbi:MAG: hypothetical protein ACI4EJ_05295 [Bacteroides sp.]